MASLAGRAAKAAASQRLSELAGSAKGGIRTVDIRWEDFNFPCRREPCNVLHVDLTELERLDQRAHSTVRVVYGWYLSLLLVVCINLLNTIIITAGVGDKVIYSGVNIVYSVFNIIIALTVGTFAFYNVYKGLATMGADARKKGQLALLGLLVCGTIQAFLGAGNANGFGSFGTDRMEAAEAMDIGVVGYWIAAIVIESLLWLANVGVGGYSLYRVYIH